jgi:copper chaperone CopZ
MKPQISIAALLAALSLGGNVQSSSAPEAAVSAENSESAAKPAKRKVRRVEFKISGTDCPVCLGRIQSKIKALNGVQKVVVWTWPPYFGLVVYDSSVVTWQEVEKSIADEHVRFIEMTEAKEPEASTK